jgi:hypothetical protein
MAATLDNGGFNPPVRVPFRWRRSIAIAVVLFLPVAVHEWPWSFLPLRWQQT